MLNKKALRHSFAVSLVGISLLVMTPAASAASDISTVAGSSTITASKSTDSFRWGAKIDSFRWSPGLDSFRWSPNVDNFRWDTPRPR